MTLTSSPNSFPNTSNFWLSHFLYNSEILLAIQLSPSDLNRAWIIVSVVLIFIWVPQKIIRNILDEDWKQRMEIIDADNPWKNISKVKKQKLEDDLHTWTTILFSLITLVRVRNNLKRNVQDDERNNPINSDEIIQRLQFYGITGWAVAVFLAISIRYFKNLPFGWNDKGTEKTNETKK